MTDKEQIIIDGENLERIKKLLYEGQKMAISTKTFEAIIEQLARKTQECEELKEKDKAYENLALHIKCPHCNKELELMFNGTEEKANLLDRYRKDFEEIERYCTDYCNDCSDGDNPLETYDKCINCVSADIKDIINKANGEKNETTQRT